MSESTVTERIVDEEGHSVGVHDEPFDSELLGLRVGRLAPSPAIPLRQLEGLLARVAEHAGHEGFDQLLHRVPASSFEDIWALEAAGYHLMDIGVTFARRFDGPVEAQQFVAGGGAPRDRRRHRGPARDHARGAVGQPLRG